MIQQSNAKLTQSTFQPSICLPTYIVEPSFRAPCAAGQPRKNRSATEADASSVHQRGTMQCNAQNRRTCSLLQSSRTSSIWKPSSTCSMQPQHIRSQSHAPPAVHTLGPAFAILRGSVPCLQIPHGNFVATHRACRIPWQILRMTVCRAARLRYAHRSLRRQSIQHG